MKELKKDLQGVTKSLKQLTKKTEQIAKKLEELEKAHIAKAKVRPSKRAVVRIAAKGTASDAVMAVIKRSRRGVTTAQIKEKTGFREKKIWDRMQIFPG